MFEAIRVFGIRDKVTKEYWIAGSGKYKWFRPQDAKNAWWRWNNKQYFKKQNKYEVVEFKLVEVDKKEEMNNLAFRKKLGLK